MASTKPIARILQRPPAPEPRDPPPWTDGLVKGEPRPPVDAIKPSRERESGDLEPSEREVHGRA